MKKILTLIALAATFVGVSGARAETSSQTQTVTLHFNPLAHFSVGIGTDGGLSVSARSRVGSNPTTTLTQIALLHNSDHTVSRIASVSSTALYQNVVHTTIPSQYLLAAAFSSDTSNHERYAIAAGDGADFGYQLASEKGETHPAVEATDEATMVYVLSNP
jgi:hypothetical protein